MQRSRPSFVYVLPNFQNPGGVTLSLPRRRLLAELAARNGVPVIEDDPYGRLRFEGQDLTPVIQLDSELQSTTGSYRGNVIYLSTFSKTLSPGIRLAWIIAPKEVIAKLVIAKQGTDLHTSTLVQMVAFELEKDRFLEGHVETIRTMYRSRRDAMLAALDGCMNGAASWTRPEGGLFLWCTLAAVGIDTRVLLARAIERRVAFVPGTAFYPDDDRGRNQMRLNFSFSSPDIIREGISRLGKVLEDCLAPAA